MSRCEMAEPINETPIEDVENDAPVLSRDMILQADETATLEPIDLSEWGGAGFIRILSGTERDAIEAEHAEGNKDLQNFRARFAVKVLSNENGERLFEDSDAKALGKKSGLVLDRIMVAGLRVNGFSEDEIEELEKN